MRMITFLAFVFAVSEGVLGFHYLTGEGHISPSDVYLFRIRKPEQFNRTLTIYDACERLHQACDKYVKTIVRVHKDGSTYHAHHAINCRPDLSTLPTFYASCAYRMSPTPGEPSTYDPKDIPIDVSYAAMSHIKDYQIFPRGDEALRGIKIDEAADSAGHHSDHSHQS